MSQTKKPVRLTPNMRYVLEGIVAGKDPFHGCAGRSEHGARLQTLLALRSRGLLDAGNRPNEQGRAIGAPGPHYA